MMVVEDESNIVETIATVPKANKDTPVEISQTLLSTCKDISGEMSKSSHEENIPVVNIETPSSTEEDIQEESSEAQLIREDTSVKISNDNTVESSEPSSGKDAPVIDSVTHVSTEEDIPEESNTTGKEPLREISETLTIKNTVVQSSETATGNDILIQGTEITSSEKDTLVESSEATLPNDINIPDVTHESENMEVKISEIVMCTGETSEVAGNRNSVNGRQNETELGNNEEQSKEPYKFSLPTEKTGTIPKAKQVLEEDSQMIETTPSRVENLMSETASSTVETLSDTCNKTFDSEPIKNEEKTEDKVSEQLVIQRRRSSRETRSMTPVRRSSRIHSSSDTLKTEEIVPERRTRR